MPLGYKDPGDVAAEAVMLRMFRGGAVLVVEGVTDLSFWSVRCHPTCELVDGEGKANVIGGVQKLDTAEFDGVLGVVDDDYDSLVAVELGTNNIVRTDARDLEAVLCRSSAIEKALAEFGSSSKIQVFEATQGIDVQSGLLERALPFGRLRLAAALYGLDLRQDAIRVQRFVDASTWETDEDALVRAVARPEVVGHEELVKRSIAELPTVDPWLVVRGHDLIEILRIGLQRVLGDIRPHIGAKEIARVLRAGFSAEDLRTTEMWGRMRTWETRNEAFPILRG